MLSSVKTLKEEMSRKVEDLKRLKIPQLKELGNELGVTIPSRAKKGEIIELLVNHKSDLKESKETSLAPWMYEYHWGGHDDDNLTPIRYFRSKEEAYARARKFLREVLVEHYGEDEFDIDEDVETIIREGESDDISLVLQPIPFEND